MFVTWVYTYGKIKGPTAYDYSSMQRMFEQHSTYVLCSFLTGSGSGKNEQFELDWPMQVTPSPSLSPLDRLIGFADPEREVARADAEGLVAARKGYTLQV